MSECQLSRPQSDREMLNRWFENFFNTSKLESMLEGALDLMITTVCGKGGLILIPDPPPSVDRRYITCRLPENWVEQLDDPDSSLHRIAQQVRDERLAQDVPDHLGLCGSASLRGEEGRYGAVLIYGSQDQARDENALREMARWTGRALERLDLWEQSREHTQVMDTLQWITATLRPCRHFEDDVASILQGIQQILHAEAACLCLLDETAGDLVLVGDGNNIPVWKVYRQKTTLWEILKSRNSPQPTRLVREDPSDPLFQLVGELFGGLEVRSAIWVPLVNKDELLGFLLFVDQGRGISEEPMEDVLAVMAATVANSMYNARLIRQLTVANTDLEASRWEVLRSRNALQALFDGILEPLYIVDRDFHVLAVNRRAADGAGRASHELLGRRCHQALHHRSEPCPGCRVTETLFRGVSTQRMDRRWLSGLEPQEWEIHTYPIWDEEHRPVQAIVFWQDVTEKRRLESSLAQSERMALVGQLAAGVAHEINNPLAVIIANTQMMQRELGDHPACQEGLRLIASAGERAYRVVRDLMKMAQRDRWDLAPTDVNQTIQKAVDLLTPDLSRRSIDVHLHLSDGLPPLKGNSDRLQGMWLNLLINARDSISGSAGQIDITSRWQGSQVAVVVADNGGNILQSTAADSTDREVPIEDSRQEGLGLSICQRIAKQHGGHIQVDSRSEKGIEFRVFLPVRP